MNQPKLKPRSVIALVEGGELVTTAEAPFIADIMARMSNGAQMVMLEVRDKGGKWHPASYRMGSFVGVREA